MMKAAFIAIAAVGATMLLSACAPAEMAPGTIQAAQSNGFTLTLETAKARLDAQMALGITVPVPLDAGGGYTHEKHKLNAKLTYDAGQLYALTGEQVYADFAGQMMLAYADVYPGWGLHPAQKEQSPGRMFWQNLNESWWLLHVSQAYGNIKKTLPQDDRDAIENDLLRNMAEFLSDGSPETFNKIHNHGTWATAAVGLTGYAIGDQDYVQQALLGLDKSGDAGFLKQMDRLFSPDGYYNEGPYYQRYALMPFVIFAQAVEKNDPDQKIFERRDGILKKAILTTIQQSYGGLFFPINDALKDKGIATAELLHGVAIAYDLTGDPGLLSIAKAQGQFVLTPESRAVANDLTAGKAEPFAYQTMRLNDGADGTEGALDILRASSDPKGSAVVMKNTSQGLGHGHFDKLGFIFYDNGNEIISDYGAARFLNIVAKYGGHYLPENNAYAKQTIAHNVLVVDGKSHFNGDTDTGNMHAPTVGQFVDTENLKLASASIDTAYDSVTLKRTMAIAQDAAFEKPIVFDLMQARSADRHDFDLPFYYQGQLIETNFTIDADTQARTPLGQDNGYQYLWKTGSAKPVGGLSQITWLEDRRFYTLTTALPENSDIILAELGANDPNFNLRREPAAIMRTPQARNVSYASIIEPHGEYNPIAEFTLNSQSHIKSVRHYAQDSLDYIHVETGDGQSVGLGIAQDVSPDAAHVVETDKGSVSWTGPYKLFHSEKHIHGDTHAKP